MSDVSIGSNLVQTFTQVLQGKDGNDILGVDIGSERAFCVLFPKMVEAVRNSPDELEYCKKLLLDSVNRKEQYGWKTLLQELDFFDTYKDQIKPGRPQDKLSIHWFCESKSELIDDGKFDVEQATYYKWWGGYLAKHAGEDNKAKR